MITLTRDQHCALAKIDVQAFKTLQRNERIPVLPKHLRAPSGFSAFETLALLTAVSFRGHFFMLHEQAAFIASEIEVILPRWSEIIDAGNSSPMTEILFGQVTFPFGEDRPKTVCGTLAELSAGYPEAPMSFIAFSMSRIVAVMRVRAERLGIDLDEFWYPPTPASTPKQTPAKKSAPKKRRTS